MYNIDDLLPSRSQAYPPKGLAIISPIKKKEETLSACAEVNSIEDWRECNAPPVMPV